MLVLLESLSPDQRPDQEDLNMRIFVAGATGAIGAQLVPQLIAAGHVVAGMTRSERKSGRLRELGAQPIVCDVFDAAALAESVTAFAPDAVIHQLTDLPQDPAQIPAAAAANNRVRREGTRNLIAAAQTAAARRFLGTYHEHEPAPPPAVHVDEAARRTVEALDAPSGTITIVDAALGA